MDEQTNKVTEQTYAEARIIIRDCVCSHCWSTKIPLQITKDNEVVCPECGNVGYVSKAYVEERRSRDRSDYLEAKRNLPSLFPPEEKKTQEQILKELGF